MGLAAGSAYQPFDNVRLGSFFHAVDFADFVGRAADPNRTSECMPGALLHWVCIFGGSSCRSGPCKSILQNSWGAHMSNHGHKMQREAPSLSIRLGSAAIFCAVGARGFQLHMERPQPFDNCLARQPFFGAVSNPISLVVPRVFGFCMV